MIRPTLRQFEYLIAIEDTGSFSRAAERCFVTQSTLSAGIKEIETILKQTLIVRGRKKAELTPFGQATVDQARSILTQVDGLLEYSRSLSAPLTGPLRIGVIPTIAPYLLPQILPGLQKKFPNLDLQLHEDLSHRLLEQLHQRRLDILLMAFPFDTPDLEQHILFHEDFMVVCPKNHPHPKTYSLEDLGKEKLLLLEEGHCLRDHALSACKIQMPRQRKTFSATSLPTLIQMVSHGFGVTLLPAMAGKDTGLPPNLKCVPFRAPRPGRTIGLAWSKSSPKIADYALLAKTIAKIHAS